MLRKTYRYEVQRLAIEKFPVSPWVGSQPVNETDWVSVRVLASLRNAMSIFDQWDKRAIVRIVQIVGEHGSAKGITVDSFLRKRVLNPVKLRTMIKRELTDLPYLEAWKVVQKQIEDGDACGALVNAIANKAE